MDGSKSIEGGGGILSSVSILFSVFTFWKVDEGKRGSKDRGSEGSGGVRWAEKDKWRRKWEGEGRWKGKWYQFKVSKLIIEIINLPNLTKNECHWLPRGPFCSVRDSISHPPPPPPLFALKWPGQSNHFLRFLTPPPPTAQQYFSFSDFLYFHSIVFPRISNAMKWGGRGVNGKIRFNYEKYLF